MHYDVLTIDTSTLKQYGYKFNEGLLATLNQFKDSTTKLVFSSVVLGEVERHLKKDMIEVREKHRNALTELKRKFAATDLILESIQKLIDSEESPEELTTALLTKFLSETGAQTIEADNLTADILLDLYFKPEAPFENSTAKKNEFPDAIALLSLEGWAKEHKLKILAVSKDKGWSSFSKRSTCIEVIEDLASALDQISQIEELVRRAIKETVDDALSNKESDGYALVEQVIVDTSESLDITAEYSSSFDLVESDIVEVTYKEFVYNDELGYNIVKSEKGEITIQMNIGVEIEATCNFDISVWDGIDREYVNLHSTTKTIDEIFDASLLITFSLEKEDQLSLIDTENTYNLEIIEVELIETPSHFDFGEVGLDDSFYK